MNPRDSMREVLTQFGADSPQAQGNSTEMGKLRTHGKVEKDTNYVADDELRLTS